MSNNIVALKQLGEISEKIISHANSLYQSYDIKFLKKIALTFCKNNKVIVYGDFCAHSNAYRKIIIKTKEYIFEISMHLLSTGVAFNSLCIYKNYFKIIPIEVMTLYYDVDILDTVSSEILSYISVILDAYHSKLIEGPVYADKNKLMSINNHLYDILFKNKNSSSN